MYLIYDLKMLTQVISQVLRQKTDRLARGICVVQEPVEWRVVPGGRWPLMGEIYRKEGTAPKTL